jgi:DNA-binding NarL/FixJ family response regulator
LTLRVVIADRSPLVRVAARSALTAGGIEVAAEADDAAGARRAIVAHRPDAALLDAELDERLDVVAEARSALPGIAVIVLSPDDSDRRALACVRAGACGFVPKDTSPDRLPDIVRGAVAGEAAIPRRIVRRILDRIAAPANEELTAREWEVLERLACGASDREIGAELGVSEITVRRHAATAARKLHVGHRDDAVAAYRRLVA